MMSIILIPTIYILVWLYVPFSFIFFAVALFYLLFSMYVNKEYSKSIEDVDIKKVEVIDYIFALGFLAYIMIIPLEVIICLLGLLLGKDFNLLGMKVNELTKLLNE